MIHRLTPFAPIMTLVSALVLLPIRPAEAQLTGIPVAGRVLGSLSAGFSGKWSTPRAVATLREALAVPATSVTPPADHGGLEVAWLIDFSDYTEGPVEEWLQAKGFRLEQGAEDPALLALSIHEGALVLEAKGPVKGFLVNQDVQLEKVSKIRIHWGIIKYPKNASYERQVNNEALMLYIFFGQDKVPSGHFAIPALPFFIGLFLGQEEQLNTPYKGRYFQESGRFVCVGNPNPYETVISEFDLIAAFQTYFRRGDVPMISGITLGIDTFSSGDKGKAAAYIYSIEFLE
jgi:hypothetical protein